ncbi:MAG TPA: YceI family protein [Gemmatimonadales bacterium]|jgi:polyisoprenoid-binding protein YceI
MTTMTKDAPKAPAKVLWQIDPTHAHLEFAVKHLMINTVRGKFTDVKGTVHLDPADLSTAEADVTIATTSVQTGVEQRDQHLRSADFFDVEKFPTITFKSRKATELTEDNYTLLGDLTVHGVTQPVHLTVTPEGSVKDPWGGERMAFSARGKLNRKDFGLVWNMLLEAGGVAVADEVKLTIEVELVKQK